MSLPLEWSLARRYLRLPVLRSARIHIVSAVFALAAIFALVLRYYVQHKKGGFVLLNFFLRTVVQWMLPVTLAAFVLVFFFVLLARRFTIFSTISTYGLFLGTGAMVVVLSVMSGFEKDLKHKILGANAHIVVTDPDRSFTDYEAVRKQLLAVPDVVAVTPFLSSEVMITSASNLSGVVLKGIDPATVGAVTDLSKNIEQGGIDNIIHPEKLDAPEPPAPAPKPPTAPSDTAPPDKLTPEGFPELPTLKKKPHPSVIVGRELAKNLRTYLGDDVNMVSLSGDIGPTGAMPRSRPFRVGGVFYSGMYEYDSKYVYMSIPAAQKFLALEDEITGFELKVKDVDKTDGPAEEIRRRLGAGYEVETWQESNRHLFSALSIEQVAMFIVLCFVILVASFSILANGIMLVREKGPQIAILKSLGMSDGGVLRIFLYVGLSMGAVGTLVGVAAGVGASLGLRHFGFEINSDVFYISRLPVEVDPVAVCAISGAAMLLALVAILYPALQAARTKPVEGLRYDRN